MYVIEHVFDLASWTSWPAPDNVAIQVPYLAHGMEIIIARYYSHDLQTAIIL